MSGAPPRKPGAAPASRRIQAIIAVTVDLPLVPATATLRPPPSSSASTSARRRTGMPASRAARVMARVREMHGGQDYDARWGRR